MVNEFLKQPGFIYEISGRYYFLGKWICKECTEIDACDCVVMYNMCRSGNEEPDTNFYFQKIRAYSDFALEIPYNPLKVKEDLTTLLNQLSDRERAPMELQLKHFQQDFEKYCG